MQQQQNDLQRYSCEKEVQRGFCLLRNLVIVEVRNVATTERSCIYFGQLNLNEAVLELMIFLEDGLFQCL